MGKAFTKEEFILRAKKVHGDRFDYSLVKYKNALTNVFIICSVHGRFKQLPSNHLKGHSCNACSSQSTAKKLSSNTPDFIKKAKAIHKKRYDYSKVDYVNCDTPVTIICSVHKEFFQTPDAHLAGKGCNDCGNELTAKMKTCTTLIFIEKAKRIHGETYDYSLVNYINNITKIKIICHIHEGFLQTPDGHLAAKGCPSCAKSGFNPIIPATLYYLRVETRNQLCYKIGITNLTVKERFRKDKSKITVLSEKFHPFGIDAQDEEKRIMREHKAFKYTGELILRDGNSELFSKDVLLLDNGYPHDKRHP
ncbi:hypothetical protein [Colwellia piezophila]|uniref:hypothetical protein n=1 Tax=Colwellia piezophila TaxID=211668 RepID=UPI0003747E2A|nr:hypothetical protein [Colwellia piezophila]